MTYEEAIKILTELKPIPVDGFKIIAKAYDLAIEALEKQEPKKPKVTIHSYINSDDGFFSRYFCPNCNLLICSEDKYGLFSGRKQEQCGRCGQAIDWSVRE